VLGQCENLLFLQTWSFRNWSLSLRHLPLPRIEGTLNLRLQKWTNASLAECVGHWTLGCGENRPAVEHINLTCQSPSRIQSCCNRSASRRGEDCCASSIWRRRVLRAGLKAWQAPGTNQPPQLQNWGARGAGNYTRPEFPGNATRGSKGSTPPTQTPIFCSIISSFH
jgi:hypothetical protein